MINHLDNLLRHLFLSQIAELADEDQVRFQPPDEDWRTHVSNLQGSALNIYLADLRENRRLRSNARTRSIENGFVSEEPAPRRIDCHYLITAWSAAQPGPAVEPTPDEHALLYEAAGVLMNNEPLNPSRIYPPDSPALDAVPEPIREADLPTTILPAEGFPKLAEFWSGMGNGSRWKPGVYLVVTLPVVMLPTTIAGPLVTTHIIKYRRRDKPGIVEEWIQIGGHVLDATMEPPRPLAGVSVQLESLAGERSQATETDERGQFAFGELRAGRYRLRAQSTELGERSREVDIPPAQDAEPGDYDLQFE